jgi:site-specific recombinase XerD
MEEKIRLTLYFDNRRKKTEGSYPVKLRLYQPSTTKEKLFRTGFDCTENEFDQVYLKKEPQERKNKFNRNEKEKIELKFSKIEIVKLKAEGILTDLKEFSFDEFEKRFYNKNSKLNVYDYFEEYIQNLKKDGQIRTADTYFYSLKKLKEFFEQDQKKHRSQITFETFTKSKLLEIENYCREKGHTNASIGFYLRPLRSIFNYAIADPNSGIKPEIYPFGNRKYTIPSGQNIKKALTNHQLKILFELEPINEHQRKAKAFWFFSYLANGMNFKDIAELKFENIQGNRLVFYRSKTKITTKSKPSLITAILPEFALNIIKEYGNPTNTKKDNVFNIIEKTDTPIIANSKITAFIRFTNQHIKNMVKQYNDNLIKTSGDNLNENNLLTEEISTYWARHSFTTQAMRKGASMELLQESLGHKNLATTQNYFAGFTSEVKEELSKSLLDF